METWRQLSDDSLRAAEALLREGCYRSSVSRSYYAVYCAVTHEVVQRLTSFAYGWNNPPHEKLSVYVENNLTLVNWKKDNIKRLIRTLRRFREDADYRPYRVVDNQIARDCIRDAQTVRRLIRED